MEPETMNPKPVEDQRAYVQWETNDGFVHTSGVMNRSDADVFHILLTGIHNIVYAKVHQVEVRAWPISFDATSI